MARRSRDGEVASLREDGALAFSMMLIHKSNGMQPLPKPATPQALRASSPSRGAFWVGVFTGAEIRLFISELQIEILDANKPFLLGE